MYTALSVRNDGEDCEWEGENTPSYCSGGQGWVRRRRLVDAAVSDPYRTVVEHVIGYADTAAPGPTLPAWPPQLPPDATPEEKMAHQKAANDANNQGLAIIKQWWANLLATSTAPLQENLTLFWRNHFATSNEKVRHPDYMLAQNQLFRTKGMGTFASLLTAVAKGPAMLVWLDGQSNVKAHPNENWAREAMELFTMGIGNYTEQDVREGRAHAPDTRSPMTARWHSIRSGSITPRKRSWERPTISTWIASVA